MKHYGKNELFFNRQEEIENDKGYDSEYWDDIDACIEKEQAKYNN